MLRASEGISAHGVDICAPRSHASNLLLHFNDAAKAATQFARRAATTGRRSTRPALEPGGPDCYSRLAYGVHGAIVEVDPDLCDVKIRRYVCIHDCGNMINPTIVEGQVLGGIAQGLGGALYERIEYDPEGNPLNANFVDFLVPYATEVPSVEVLHLETPTPLNPLGVKGVGEAGCIAVARGDRVGRGRCARAVRRRPLHQTPITPSDPRSRWTVTLRPDLQMRVSAPQSGGRISEAPPAASAERDFTVIEFV
jgi:CO/xanthine dehydrogenase Mo-binding subunit